MQNSQDFQRDLAAVSLDAIVGEPLTGSGFETDEPELTDPYSEKELVCYYLGELSPSERDGRRPGSTCQSGSPDPSSAIIDR